MCDRLFAQSVHTSSQRHIQSTRREETQAHSSFLSHGIYSPSITNCCHREKERSRGEDKVVNLLMRAIKWTNFENHHHFIAHDAKRNYFSLRKLSAGFLVHTRPGMWLDLRTQDNKFLVANPVEWLCTYIWHNFYWFNTYLIRPTLFKQIILSLYSVVSITWNT